MYIINKHYLYYPLPQWYYYILNTNFIWIIFSDTRPVYAFSYVGGYDGTFTNSYRWVPSGEPVPVGQPWWVEGEPSQQYEQHMAYMLDEEGHLTDWVDITGSTSLLFTCETP